MERKEFEKLIEELQKEIEELQKEIEATATPEENEEANKGLNLVDKFIEDTADMRDSAVYACISMIIDDHCKRIGMSKSRFIWMLAHE